MKRKLETVIDSYYQILTLNKTDPEQAAMLLQQVISDKNECIRIITGLHEFTELSKAFPLLAPELVQILLSDRQMYIQIIKSANILQEMILLFPEQALELIQPLLSDKQMRNQIIKEPYHLSMLAKATPEHAPKLLELFFSDKQEYSRMVTSKYCFQVLSMAFPNQASTLFERLLTDTQMYFRIIQDIETLEEMTKAFPEHACKLLIFAFFDKRVEFEALRKDTMMSLMVPDLPAFFAMAQEFPQYAEKLLAHLFVDYKRFMPASKAETAIDDVQLHNLISRFTQISVDTDIIERFENMAKLYAKKTAVYYNNQTLTYKELNQKINQLAHFILDNSYHIPQKANKAQSHIGIRGSNLLQIVILQFACLKTGAAFIIIDKDEPVERLNLIAQDSSLDIIINCDESEPVTLLSGLVEIQCNLREFKSVIASKSIENPGRQFFPDQLAYLIATSGSTGRPKIVMQTRQGLLGQMKYYSEAIALSANDNLLGISPPTHDQGLSNVFSALLTGAAFYIFKLANNNIQDAIKFIKTNKITVYVSVPMVWAMIADKATKNDLVNIRIVRLGGEEPKLIHARLFDKKCASTAQLFVAYGTSECSFITIYLVNVANLKDTIPMGKLLPHVRARHSSGEGKKLEIYSPFMAKGYTNEEENLKAYQQFGDEKFYKTGDIVSIHDGILIFEGRKQWHVKIAGNRINLREIEKAVEKIVLTQTGFHSECVVVTVGKGHQTIVVAYISGNNKTIDIKQLRTKLKSLIPSYAIPQTIGVLEEFPRLSNNKIDRVNMKALAEESVLSNREKIVAKINSLDDLLKYMNEIWCYILDIDNAFLQKNEHITFNQLGGDSVHSIAAAKLINEMINMRVLGLTGNKQINLIEPFDVHIRDLPEFTKMVSSKIYDYWIKNTNRIDRNLNTIPSALVRPYQFDSKEFPDFYSVSSINFHAMQNLVSYFSYQHSVDMRFCIDYKDFVQTLVAIVQEGKTEQQYGLIGIQGSYEAHCFPAVLCYNAMEKKWGLFFSDSLGMARVIRYRTQIKNLLNTASPIVSEQILFYTDCAERLKDETSCNIDALYYLASALRLPSFFESVQIVEPKKCDSPLLFLSPPVCMQNYQLDNYVVNISGIKYFMKDEAFASFLKSDFYSDTLKQLHAHRELLGGIDVKSVDKVVTVIALNADPLAIIDGKNHLVMQKNEEGYLVFWLNEKEQPVSKFLKYEAFSYDVLESMPQPGNQSSMPNFYLKLKMMVNDTIFPRSQHTDTKPVSVNTFCINDAEKLYRICIYGPQLCNLDRQLTQYLHHLEKYNANVIPGFFSEGALDKSQLIQQKNIIIYLKFLVGLEVNEPVIKDVSVHEKILESRELTKIVQDFIQSLGGTYLIHGTRVAIEDNDIGSFIHLLQKDAVEPCPGILPSSRA